ncbi:hypothetical protein ACWCQQ_29030 [Streptomyces sp. NPDC002143]
MKTQWRGISRRRSLVVAGAVTALLVSGGAAVAVAASGDDSTSTDTGITLTEVPGTPDLDDVTMVDPGEAVPLPDVPVVVGEEGQTNSR